MDNRLLDYALWRPGAPDGVGDVHRGRVIASVPAMAGAFVALADAEGFLPDSEGAKGLTAGTMLTVRVTRAAQGGKGPRLTREAADDRPVGSGPLGAARGVVRIRSAARRAIPTRRCWWTIRRGGGDCGSALRDRSRSSVFDEDVAEAIEALTEPEVELPGGARLSIYPTPALVAIDVDAGGAAGGKRCGKRHEAVNRAVLPELARQIRLRNLSGAILVDLAGMTRASGRRWARISSTALADDPLRPRFLGFTALGLGGNRAAAGAAAAARGAGGAAGGGAGGVAGGRWRDLPATARAAGGAGAPAVVVGAAGRPGGAGGACAARPGAALYARRPVAARRRWVLEKVHG